MIASWFKASSLMSTDLSILPNPDSVGYIYTVDIQKLYATSKTFRMVANLFTKISNKIFSQIQQNFEKQWHGYTRLNQDTLNQNPEIRETIFEQVKRMSKYIKGGVNNEFTALQEIGIHLGELFLLEPEIKSHIDYLVNNLNCNFSEYITKNCPALRKKLPSPNLLKIYLTIKETVWSSHPDNYLTEETLARFVEAMENFNILSKRNQSLLANNTDINSVFMQNLNTLCKYYKSNIVELKSLQNSDNLTIKSYMKQNSNDLQSKPVYTEIKPTFDISLHTTISELANGDTVDLVGKTASTNSDKKRLGFTADRVQVYLARLAIS